MGAFNVNSIALQLEKVRKTVPTAYEQEHILLDMIEEKGDLVDASTRNVRLPILIRPGGKASQGTGDFDDMGRGSGSVWDVGTLSTLQFRHAFEVSKLAEYATKGNEKAVESVAVREVAEAMKMFKRFLDVVFQTNGTGQLDTIGATYVFPAAVFPVANPNMFYFNQDIQVYPAGLAAPSRGLCTVTSVDPNAIPATITVNAAPAGTIAGDALVINISQGAGGANPISMQGLTYNHVDSVVGTWNNLARPTYPEVLKTPHVALAGAAITPALARLGLNKLRRVLGTDFSEPMITFMNVGMEAQWENVGLVVSQVIANQVTGDSSMDMLKRKPPKTFCGIPIKTSIHAPLQRVDVLMLKHWGRAVTKIVGFFEEGGQTVFPIYGASTGLVAGYLSYLDVVMNAFMDLPRAGVFYDNAAVPAGY
jgi:hypothetical protein